MAKFDIVVRVTVQAKDKIELQNMEIAVLDQCEVALLNCTDIVDVALSHICDEDGMIVKEG